MGRSKDKQQEAVWRGRCEIHLFFIIRIESTSKTLFGLRKPRCVDFSRQTYSERYDFFGRFRSFSSTAIDRGIGIDRFGVEKTTFDFCTEMYGAPAKNCSGPENRDASILVGKHIANAMIFSTVFDASDGGR